MLEKKEWAEFRDTKMLWFVNRLLHVFGWAIVYEFDDKNTLSNVFPARVTFRGFPEDDETSGFIGLSEFMAENAEQLLKESKED